MLSPRILFIAALLAGAVQAQTFRDEGTMAYRRGDYPRAVSLYEKSLETALKSLKEDDIELVERRSELGEAYRAAGRMEDAIKQFDYVWKRARYDAENRHRWDEFEGKLAMSTAERLGRAYQSTGKLDDALLVFSTGLFDAERTHHDEDALQFAALAAETQFLAKKEVDAATTAAKAFASAEKMTDKPALQSRALSQLSALCLRHRQLGLARPMAQRALDIALKHETDSISIAEYQTQLAETMIRTEAFDEAEKFLRDAREVVLKHETTGSVKLLPVLLAMSDLALKRGQPEAALAHANDALEICKKRLPELDPRFGLSLSRAADSQSALHQPQLAKPLYEQATGILEKMLGAEDPVTVAAREQLKKLGGKIVIPAKSSAAPGQGK